MFLNQIITLQRGQMVMLIEGSPAKKSPNLSHPLLSSDFGTEKKDRQKQKIIESVAFFNTHAQT